eukprot:CAMPEP_0115626594 /NCGR_PEP_ID=MMETSP0272-20121206/28430_1 /TAXON_ID=71861 /ORGANISM="Scrippsiella trochoidea, Strain CCMP3099" /LENGTH=78 /DNA_ID=CAMNT_0003062965 /DNA_START=99 /DNA_END=332 /DNA_ORIENTATION=-
MKRRSAEPETLSVEVAPLLDLHWQAGNQDVQLTPVEVDSRLLAACQLAGDDLLRKCTDNVSLEPPAQRACPELGVVRL